jgi:hypothetical protein
LALAASGITCRLDRLVQPSTLDLQLTVAADTVGIADSVRLVAVVTADGKPNNAVRVVWSTNAPGVATVDTTGLVRGVVRGPATITARIENAVFLAAPLTDSATVQVVVPRVVVTPDSTTLRRVGAPICLTAVPLDAAGDTVAGVTVAFTTVDPDTTLTPGATPGCYVARKGGAPAQVRASIDIAADTATVTVQQVAATLIATPDSVRFYTLTRQRTLSAAAVDSGGTPIPAPTINWTSSNGNVAAVTTAGVVTAQDNGISWIRAQSGGATDSVKIVVQQVADSIAVSPASDTLRTVRGRATLTATVRDSANQTIGAASPVWTSLSPDSVRIVSYGGNAALVEAVAEGGATIVAQDTVAGQALTSSARITVRYQLVSLLVTPANATLFNIGDTVRFTATGRDANDSVVPQPRAAWRAVDTLRVRIDSLSGLATAKNPGSTNVIALRDAVADTAAASVTPPVLNVDTTSFVDSMLRSSPDSVSVIRTVGNTGTGTLGAHLAIVHGASWLSVTPDTVNIPATSSTSIRLTARAGLLPEGTYVDTVRVQSAVAAGSPQNIRVRFTVYCPLVAIAADTAHAAGLAATDCAARHQAGSFADYYAFTGVAGDTLRIALATSPTSLDTYLYLLNAAGAVIASNDNCPGAGLNSCLQFVVPANGQYTIEATSFNGGAAFSYTLGLTHPVAPGAPTALAQLANGTPIAAGDSTNTSTVEFRATGSDPNPRDTLRLQVEVRDTAQAFQNTPTATGSAVPNAGGGVPLSATASGLQNFTSYHWQVRVIDQTGRTGPWTAFGGGVARDFRVAITTPVIEVTPSEVADTALFGATAIDTFALLVANTGTGTFTWSASEASPRITTAATGANPGDTLKILLNPSGLAAGTYTDTVTVTAAGAVGSPVTIVVTFVIEQPVLVVNRDSVTRSTNAGSEASFADTISIVNGGNGSLAWTATHNLAQTWLSFTRTSGGAPDSIPLTISSSGLAPGVYRDTIVVDAGTASGSPRSIPVTLTVHQPVLVVAPTTIQDSANFASTTPRTVTLHVTNGDGGTMTWTATKTAAWVTLSKTSGGGASDSVIVTLHPDTLSGVLHRDTITFISPEANDTIEVTVEFDILQPILSVTPDSIVDSAVQLSGATPVHTLGVTNAGRGVLSWSAVDDTTWITLAADTVLDTLTVTLSSTGLLTGTHSGKVIVTALNATGSPDTIPVTFTITPPPVLSISPASYADSAFRGSLAAKSVVLHVSNTGPGTFNWTALKDTTWVGLTGTSGVPGDSIIVTLTPGTLANGTHSGTVMVTAPGAAGSPATIPISFKIKPCAEPAVIPDTLVTGSVALTDCGAPLRSGSVAKLYSVNANAGDTLSFRLTAGFDAYLALSDSFGVSLRQNDECPTETGTACVKDYPVTVTGRYIVEATTANSADTGAFALLVVKERAPGQPQSIGQFKGDSTTSIGTGLNTDQTVAVFKGTLNDPNARDSVRLEIHFALASSPLGDTPTHVSGYVAVGQTAWIRVTALAENFGYHWKARTCDKTLRCSAWLDFGVPDPAADFYVNAILETPAATDTGQFMANGTTSIPLGGTAGSGSATVVFKALVTDPDPGDQILLELELKDVGTTGPDGTGLRRGAGVATNTKASVTVTGITGAILVGTSYYWRVRACDQTNRCSAWVNFGSNVNTSGGFLNPADPDFHVNP